jgi:hypothetical protein
MVLLAALAGGLAHTPLFNVLSYEFCLALALAGSFAAAHLGSVTVAAARDRDDGMLFALRPPLPGLLLLLGRGVLANLLLLVLPLCIISLNALRVKNCDYPVGLAFFGMMPVLSVLLASCLGSLWAVLVPRPVLATALALSSLLVSLAWGLYRFYDAPPIFGYDPFVGYFAGALYDADVALRGPFYVYRVHNLAWLAAAVLFAALFFDPTTLRLRFSARRRSRTVGAAALLCLVAAALLFHRRGALGFAPDAAAVREALGGVRHTTHVDLYYPREMAEDSVGELVEVHEYRYAQLAGLLGNAPPRITSFVFRSSEEKRALMGASGTAIAKPWRKEVYLSEGHGPGWLLKHELAHVFAASFGDRIFGISLRWRMTPLPHPELNVGLVEGLAVAAAWPPHGDLDGHQVAATLVRVGLAPPVAGLFGPGFLTHAPARAYTLAGSFCRYLLERYGVAKLREVYRSAGDFRQTYGRPLAALLEEWSAFLAKLDVPEAAVQLAREEFRAPGVFHQVCSHVVANLVSEAGRRQAEDRPREALPLLERVVRDDPGEPRHLLALMQTLADAEEPKRALAVEKRLLAHPSVSRPLERQALLLGGDIHWNAGDVIPARQSYAQAARLAAHAAERRLLYLKRWALDQPDPVRRVLRAYLLRVPGEKRNGALEVHLAHALKDALPGSGIGPYLVGKQLAGQGACREAVSPLRRSLELGLLDQDFVREARLVLGRCLYQAREDGAAAEVWFALRANAGSRPGARLEAADWLERIAWRRRAPRGLGGR